MISLQQTLPLLFGTTTASLSSLTKLSELIGNSRKNATGARPGLRDLPGQSGNFADYFKPYGCWCNFDQSSDKIAYGRGKPVDAWDQLCKNLQGSYECAVIDAKARGESCDPLTLDFAIEDYDAAQSAYKMKYGTDPWAWAQSDPSDVKQFGLTDPLWMCSVQDDRCKTEVCIAEYWFLMEAWSMIFTLENDLNIASGQPELIEQLMTANTFLEDGFDRDANCPANGNGNDSGKQCCGNWPRRHSFKSKDQFGNARSCCESSEQARDFNNNWYTVGTGKVFDSTLLKCCSDGSLADIGNDC